MINDYEATKPMTEDATLPARENDEVVSTLNTLIEVCRDGQEGFRTAADGVESAELREKFKEFSQQRAEFSDVLKGLVRSLGGDPENGGSIAGAAHRGWMDIKSVVTGGDREAILNECERGEDRAKAAYEEAQTKVLPLNIATVVNQQAHAVIAAHDRIRALRDNASRTASPGSGF